MNKKEAALLGGGTVVFLLPLLNTQTLLDWHMRRIKRLDTGSYADGKEKMRVEKEYRSLDDEVDRRIKNDDDDPDGSPTGGGIPFGSESPGGGETLAYSVLLTLVLAAIVVLASTRQPTPARTVL